MKEPEGVGGVGVVVGGPRDRAVEQGAGSSLAS